MSIAALTAGQFRSALQSACRTVPAARAELTALDAVAGDGDLGETFVAGFTAVGQAMAGLDEPADVGAVLAAAGAALGKAAPSTFGTLLGMAWRDAGRALVGQAELTAAGVARMLDIMAAGVAKRGGVMAGQRTVLDALLGGRDYAQAAAGGTAAAALAAAAAGARAGAAATAHMQAQVGRAGWLSDRANGQPDAGAIAWAVISSALAEAAAAGED